MASARPLLLLLIALAAALALAPPARADDVGERFRARFRAEVKKGIRIHAERIEVDPGGKRAILSGDCRVETRDGARIQIFADGMVLWGEFTQIGKVVDALELYAEGSVFLSAFGDSFEADSLYLDLREGDGRLEKATLRSQGSATRGSPVLARAERARVSDGLSTFEGESAVLSTCTYHEPHFALAADRIRVGRAIPDEVKKVEEGDEETEEFEVDGARLEVYDVPFLAWPGTLSWDTAWDRFLPSVTPGSSGRFGAFALTKIPLYPGKSLQAHGTLNLYEERGVGVGGGATWGGPPKDDRTYWGFFDAFYIHDQASKDTSTDQPIEDPDRLRLRGFHRDDLPLGFRREVELSYLSDRGLLPEYFEKESKQGKEQETVLYARWLHDDMGADIEGRFRLNDFQTQAEYLPRGRFFWIGEPFFERFLPFGRGVYLTSAIEVSNIRQRYDEATLIASADVRRFDLENRLDWPFPVGPVQVDPFVLGRYSAWSTGLDTTNINTFNPKADGESLDRWVGGGGAVVTTDVWRDFGDFRHVMTPSTGYVSVFHVDTPPEELYQIDEMETVRTDEFVPLGLRNRIQFWAPFIERPRDVIDWNLSTRLYVRPDRDNAGDRVGPLRSDLRSMPLPMVTARWRSDWDLNRGGGLFRSDTDVAYHPQSDWAIGVSHHFFEGSYRALGGSLDARLTEKWAAHVSSQYDFEQGRFTNNRFTLVRYFHRFVLDLAIDADFGEKDVRFAVHFMPLELYGGQDPLHGDIQRQQDPLF